MGRGRRLFLSIWQLTQGYLKKRERTSLHTSDVFPSFYSDVDIKDKNGSARRGRQEHNKRHLELSRILLKQSREAPARQPLSVAESQACSWADVASLLSACLGAPCKHGLGSRRPERLHCSQKKRWARAVGRKDNMKSLICLKVGEDGLKSKRDGQDARFLFLTFLCNCGHLPCPLQNWHHQLYLLCRAIAGFMFTEAAKLLLHMSR